MGESILREGERESILREGERESTSGSFESVR